MDDIWIWILGFAGLILGAAVSQFAEWTHLHFMIDYAWYWALLFAIGLAVVEYSISVPSERTLFNKNVSPMLLYVLWNFVQIMTNLLIVYFIFKEKPNGFHGAAYGLLAVSVGLAAYGDYVRPKKS